MGRHKRGGRAGGRGGAASTSREGSKVNFWERTRRKLAMDLSFSDLREMFIMEFMVVFGFFSFGDACQQTNLYLVSSSSSRLSGENTY